MNSQFEIIVFLLGPIVFYLGFIVFSLNVVVFDDILVGFLLEVSAPFF